MATRAVFIPGSTSPGGTTMLDVASPSSKSFTVVWRKERVVVANATPAPTNTATIKPAPQTRLIGEVIDQVMGQVIDKG